MATTDRGKSGRALSRWERFRDGHPVIVATGGLALCVAFPFAYEALRGWVH